MSEWISVNGWRIAFNENFKVLSASNFTPVKVWELFSPQTTTKVQWKKRECLRAE